MINYKTFVSSKFRADEWSSQHENVYWAKVYARFVAKYFGSIPIVPHLFHTSYLDDDIEEERDLGIEICKLELKNSGSIYFFIRDDLPEESRMSSGMMIEYDLTTEIKKPHVFIIHDNTGKIVRAEKTAMDFMIGMNLHGPF